MPVPVISPVDYNGGTSNVTNYQTMTAGQTSGTFLHLFELAGAGQSNMAASTYILSADGREQGAEVNAGTRRWIIMAATSASPVLNTSALSYDVPSACPCTHVVAGLMPSTLYQITLLGAGGTIQVTSDSNAVLTFDTDNAATTGVKIQ